MAEGEKKRAPTKLTEEEREKIRLLHAAGKSRNDIARELGRSAGAVSNTAAAMGLSFERGPEVIAATQAIKTDNAARRAAIISRLYGRTEAILDRLEDARYVASGQNTKGEVIQTPVEAIPAPEEKALAASIKDYLDEAAKLEAVDSDHGASDARSMMGALMAGLRVLNEQAQE